MKRGWKISGEKTEERSYQHLYEKEVSSGCGQALFGGAQRPGQRARGRNWNTRNSVWTRVKLLCFEDFGALGQTAQRYCGVSISTDIQNLEFSIIFALCSLYFDSDVIMCPYLIQIKHVSLQDPVEYRSLIISHQKTASPRSISALWKLINPGKAIKAK